MSRRDRQRGPTLLVHSVPPEDLPAALAAGWRLFRCQAPDAVPVRVIVCYSVPAGLPWRAAVALLPPSRRCLGKVPGGTVP